jgi:hypothetical protein
MDHTLLSQSVQAVLWTSSNTFYIGLIPSSEMISVCRLQTARRGLISDATRPFLDQKKGSIAQIMHAEQREKGVTSRVSKRGKHKKKGNTR